MSGPKKGFKARVRRAGSGGGGRTGSGERERELVRVLAGEVARELLGEWARAR